MTAVLILLVICLGWWLSKLRDRVGVLEGELQTARREAPSATELRRLADRVRQLELGAAVLVEMPVALAPMAAGEEAVQQPAIDPRITAVPKPLPVEHPVERSRAEDPVAAPPFAAPSLREPSLAERLRGMLGGQEWEVLVGGNLLNKLGALVLVIGIARFLGYSFGHVRPACRAAMAGVVSTVLLGAGIRLERQGRYRIFAGGLMGAGWAALYATSYAIYAVPEARVIQNPLVGSMGAVLVAAGMIWHSLRYRSQPLTAVAYFAAFAAMAVTPSSHLAVIGLIPLAASLLYLAWRFEWHAMALFGLAATYLTCISRGSSGAPLVATQSLFLAYWLLFDAFDLLRVRRRLAAGGLDLLFPLNSIGFLGLSYTVWAQHAPGQLWVASGIGAALFLVDSLARAAVRPPSTFEEGDDLLTRLRAGSFEGSFLVAAALAGLAVVARVPGLWTGVWLAMEAETVYLAGLRLRTTFLRRLGARAFAVSVLQTLWSVDAQSKTVLLGGHATWNWTPPLLFHSLLFYVNRSLRRPNAVMGSCAALLVGAVMVAELPVEVLGTALVVFGMALLEIGLRKSQFEFRAQSWAVLSAGAVAIGAGIANKGAWVPQLIGLGLIYFCALRTRWMDGAGVSERSWFAAGASAATAAVAALLVWRLVPHGYLALGWWVLAVMALEVGSKRLPSQLRFCFGPLALLASMDTALKLDAIGKFPALPTWLTYLGACVACLAATARLTLRPPEAAIWERTILRNATAALACLGGLITVWMMVPDSLVTVVWTAIAVAVLESAIALQVKCFRNIALAASLAVYVRVFGFDLGPAGFDLARMGAVIFVIAGMYWIWYRSERVVPSADFARLRRLQFWAAILPVIVLIESQAGAHNAPLGWSMVAIALLVAGCAGAQRDALLQSYGVAALAFTGAVSMDIDPPRLWTSVPAAALFFGAQYLSKRSSRQVPAGASVYFSLLGTLLVTALLYGRASGGLLTVSWGMQGLVLLGAGFAFRERVLRLQGLGLLLVCILKLFFYDLRNLETLYRILSFVVLGLILLSVSWTYSRFRENVRRLI